MCYNIGAKNVTGSTVLAVESALLRSDDSLVFGKTILGSTKVCIGSQSDGESLLPDSADLSVL